MGCNLRAVCQSFVKVVMAHLLHCAFPQIVMILSLLGFADCVNFSNVDKQCRDSFRRSGVTNVVLEIGEKATIKEVKEEVERWKDRGYVCIYVKFARDWNQSVDDLPGGITRITFGYCFIQPVDALPIRLTHLTFANDFNQTVNELPAHITQITFGYCFNQPVDHLPPQVTHITFGSSFNQPADELPDSITHLTFGRSFNQTMNKLPSSIINLCFGYSFRKSANRLPDSITYLT